MDSDNKDWGDVKDSKDWQSKLHVTKENRIIYLIVSGSLALTMGICVLGIILLSFYGKEIPSALVAIGSVTVGALGSVFTHNK